MDTSWGTNFSYELTAGNNNCSGELISDRYIPSTVWGHGGRGCRGAGFGEGDERAHLHLLLVYLTNSLQSLLPCLSPHTQLYDLAEFMVRSLAVHAIAMSNQLYPLVDATVCVCVCVYYFVNRLCNIAISAISDG